MKMSWGQAVLVGAVLALGVLALVIAMRATPAPWLMGR